MANVISLIDVVYNGNENDIERLGLAKLYKNKDRLEKINNRVDFHQTVGNFLEVDLIQLSGKVKENKFLNYNSKDLNKSIDFLEVLLLYHIEKLDFEEGPKGFLSTPDPEFVKKYDRSAVAIRQLEQLREVSTYPSKAKDKILPAKKKYGH